MKADYADFELDMHVRGKVWADGTVEVTRVTSHVMPSNLTRRHSKGELADDAKHDNQMDGDEWWEGGVAILDPKYATNGKALVQKAQEFAGTLRKVIQQAIYETPR